MFTFPLFVFLCLFGFLYSHSTLYMQYLLCVSVHTSSLTIGYAAAHEQYQQLQGNESIKEAIFLKRMRSRDAKKPICMIALAHLDLICSLCVP